MIKFKNVNKIYADSLYSNLSFTIHRGSFVGLSGPSGSGKTTVLRLIAGLEKQSSGHIENTFNNIGYIFQDFHLFPHLTTIDNLCIASRAKRISKNVYMNQAYNLLEKYQINHLKDRYPHELSGGEKQRVAIVRCLMQDPDLILVDEATSALDSDNTHSFMNQLKELNDKGKTIIFITHDVAILKKYATTIIQIEKTS